MLCVGTFAVGSTSTLAFADAAARRPAAESTTAVVGLRQGDTGPGVQAVQQKLISFGYYVADGADGHFGPGTTAALRVFQRQNGLNPTGVVTENDGALSRAGRHGAAAATARGGRRHGSRPPAAPIGVRRSPPRR